LRDALPQRSLPAMKDPVIGITLDCESGGNAALSRHDGYALRRNHAETTDQAVNRNRTYDRNEG